MTFRVGQKIVCIDNDRAEMLQVNSVYTVRAFERFGMYHCKGEVVYIAPIYVNECEPDADMFGFHPGRFRPATDISIFTAMLNKAKTDA